MAGTFTPATGADFHFRGYTDGGPPTTGVFAALDFVQSPAGFLFCLTGGPAASATWSDLSEIPSTGIISDVAYDATTWDGVTGVAPSKNAVRDQFVALAGATVPLHRTVNTQTGDYTLALVDDGAVVAMNKATTNTVTIPANATVAFAVGTIIDIEQIGAGVTTIAPAGGVTLNSLEAVTALAGQYASARLVKRATDTWDLLDATKLGDSDLLALTGETPTAIFTRSRAVPLANQTLNTQEMQVVYFTPRKTLTISKIAVQSGNLSATKTLVRFGLATVAANDDTTLVAATLSDTAIFAGNNTIYERALDAGGGLPTAYTIIAGTRYAAYVLAVGSSLGNVLGVTGTGGWGASDRKMHGVVSGQADLPVGAVTPVGDAKCPMVRLAF